MSARAHALPALAALTLVASGPSRQTFESTHLPKEVLALLLAAALLWWLRRRAFDRLDAALLVLAGATLLSTLLAVSPAFGWRPALLTCAAVAIALAGRGRDDRALWLGWLGAGLALLTLGGLIEGLGWARWSLHGRAPASLLGQRNTLAHVLVLGAPLVAWLGVHAASRKERLAWLGVLAVLAAVVVMTRTRAAWLAGPIAMTVFVALSFRQHWRPALVSVAGAVTGALLPAAPGWSSPTPYLDTAGRLLDADSGSGAARLLQWRTALEAVPSVFGVGPGNWCVANPACDPSVSNRFLNSDWVAWLVERGILGAAVLLAVVILAFPRWRRAADAPLSVAVLAATVVTGALDAVTQLPAALVLCTVVGFVGLGPSSSSGTQRLTGVASFFLLLGAIASSLAFASRLVSSARITTFDDLDLAVRLDPTDAVTRLELLRADLSARRCEDAAPHARVLDRQLPQATAGALFKTVCGDP